MNCLADWITPDSFFGFCALIGSEILVIQFLITPIESSDQETLKDVYPRRPSFWPATNKLLLGFLVAFSLTILICRHEFSMDTIPLLLIAITIGISVGAVLQFAFETTNKIFLEEAVLRLKKEVISDTPELLPQSDQTIFMLYGFLYKVEFSGHDTPTFTLLKTVRADRLSQKS